MMASYQSNNSRNKSGVARVGASESRSNVTSPSSSINNNNNNNAPKFGTLVPNRVFVGGISSSTTENDLTVLFSKYGNVRATKVIVDRAGVSKGYGFVTFETEEQALQLQQEADNIYLDERRLNIAPAIKKQPFAPQAFEVPPPSSPTPAVLYHHNGIPITYHNGMAFFHSHFQPAPIPQLSAAASPDPSTLYQAAATAYGPPPSPAYGHPILYANPAQVFFTPQLHQYQALPFDGLYQGAGMAIEGHQQDLPNNGLHMLPVIYTTSTSTEVFGTAPITHCPSPFMQYQPSSNQDSVSQSQFSITSEPDNYEVNGNEAVRAVETPMISIMSRQLQQEVTEGVRPRSESANEPPQRFQISHRPSLLGFNYPFPPPSTNLGRTEITENVHSVMTVTNYKSTDSLQGEVCNTPSPMGRAAYNSFPGRSFNGPMIRGRVANNNLPERMCNGSTMSGTNNSFPESTCNSHMTRGQSDDCFNSYPGRICTSLKIRGSGDNNIFVERKSNNPIMSRRTSRNRSPVGDALNNHTRENNTVSNSSQGRPFHNTIMRGKQSNNNFRGRNTRGQTSLRKSSLSPGEKLVSSKAKPSSSTDVIVYTSNTKPLTLPIASSDKSTEVHTKSTPFHYPSKLSLKGKKLMPSSDIFSNDVRVDSSKPMPVSLDLSTPPPRPTPFRTSYLPPCFPAQFQPHSSYEIRANSTSTVPPYQMQHQFYAPVPPRFDYATQQVTHHQYSGIGKKMKSNHIQPNGNEGRGSGNHRGGQVKQIYQTNNNNKRSGKVSTVDTGGAGDAHSILGLGDSTPPETPHLNPTSHPGAEISSICRTMQTLAIN